MRGVRNIYSNRLNKKAQFFILSAVIIASIIVGLATTKNYVSTGDAPKKFYYYSQQLEDETGAVVDYALYNDPNGDDPSIKQNLDSFLQLSIDRTLQSDPNMQIFACYSAPESTKLICQNNGTLSISIRLDGSVTTTVLYGSKDPSISIPISCKGTPPVCLYKKSLDSFTLYNSKYINITPQGGDTYSIPIQNSSVQRSQFYFLLKMNTTSGDYVADSTGVKTSLG